MTLPYPIEFRFWENVEKKDSGCWEWTGDTCKGYGKLFVEAERVNGKYQQRSMLAHRFSYELEYGPFDQSLCVLHRCDNPPCIRPDHLFLGTRTDNYNDMKAKGRAKHRNFTKLTEEQVLEIRSRAARGEGYTALGKEFGLARNNIWHIVVGRAWRDVAFNPKDIPNFKTLDMEKANEIRMKYSIGGISVRALGVEYGVVESAINSVLKNESWKIPEEQNPIKTKKFRPSGDTHFRSKLTEKQKEKIIVEYRESNTTKIALATKYNVGRKIVETALKKAGLIGRRRLSPPPAPSL